MLTQQYRRIITTALGCGLAFGYALPALGQVPSSTGGNIPMGTGSGSGASSGSMTGTGGTSSTGNAGTITGSPAGMRGSRGFEYPVNPTVGAGWSPNFGPGGGSHFPDDPSLVPLDAFREVGGAGNGAEGQVVTPDLLKVARSIDEPSERSLALQNLAEAAIFTNQLDIAHVTLREAALTAVALPGSLIRDQRLIAIITALINLAEADIREGKLDPSVIEADDNSKPLPRTDRTVIVRRAKLEWQRAAYLAGRIGNVTYRSEMLYRVVESASYGSEAIVNEYVPAAEGNAPASDKTKAPSPALEDNDAPKGMKSLSKVADEILIQSTQDALFIERPVWRDRALVTISTNAAGSRQYARALEIARMIPQPEVRADALVKIAEIQARGDRQKEATATYQEAATAVASIPLDDPRAVLTGVLIDNLITVGRFEDARQCSALYPDNPRRYIALGAIAESQGRRGQSQAAMDWIQREIPQQHRAQLFRRVKAGYIEAIEQNRARALSAQGR